MRSEFFPLPPRRVILIFLCMELKKGFGGGGKGGGLLCGVVGFVLCGVDGDVAGRESRKDYCFWMGGGGLSRIAEKVC